MTSPDPIPVLNALLVALWRSLPSYVVDTRLRVDREPEEFREAFMKIADEQHDLAEQIVDEIRRLGGTPDYGRFSTEFTGINDVSLRYLAAEVVRLEQQQIDATESLAAKLEDQPELKRLAERMIESAKAHVLLLKERLARSTASQSA